MEGLVKKIKGIRNEMIGLSIVLMLAGIFMILFPNTSGNIICPPAQLTNQQFRL